MLQLLLSAVISLLPLLASLKAETFFLFRSISFLFFMSHDLIFFQHVQRFGGKSRYDQEPHHCFSINHSYWADWENHLQQEDDGLSDADNINKNYKTGGACFPV